MFSQREYVEMVFCYGFANGNSVRAREEYARRFPRRNLPSVNTFQATYARFLETGSVDTRRVVNRRSPVSTHTEEDVLSIVRRDPSTSTRRISARVGASQSTVWKILKKEKLHPYHLTPVQELIEPDYQKRINFCQWLVQNESLLPNVLWTDESQFTKEGVFNFHNSHQWAHANPHATRQNKTQFKFHVNLWAGILGNTIIGPHIFEESLNANRYLSFLQDVLPVLLEDVPLAERNRIVYQHDGAPPHFSTRVKNWLNSQFGSNWIGRNGPILWPARSPDLTPLDFYLWGRLKSLVYEKPVNTREELIERIYEAVAIVKEELRNIDLAAELQKRALLCQQESGGHFENKL